MPRFAIILRSPRLQQRSGFALSMAVVFLAVIVVLAATTLDRTDSNSRTTGSRINAQTARQLAEAGIEKAVWCLNNPSNTTDCPGNPSGYNGESNVSFGRGQYTTTISGAGNSRIINSYGTIKGILTDTTEHLRVKLILTTTEVSFQYGMQAGVGGVEMKNNNKITGNVFSNGPVIGTKSLITDDAVLAVRPKAINASNDPSRSPLLTFDLAKSAGSDLYAAQSFVPTINELIHSVDLRVAKHGLPPGSTISIYNDNAGQPGTSIYSKTLTVSNDNSGWEDVWTTQTFDPATTPQLSVRTRYWIVLKVTGIGSNDNFLRVVKGADDDGYASGTAMTSVNGTTWAAAEVDMAFQLHLGGLPATLKLICEGSFCSNKVSIGGNAFAHTLDGTPDATGNYMKIGKHACYDTLIGSPAAGVPFSDPPGGAGELCSASSTGTVPCANGNTGGAPAPYCHPGNPDLNAVEFPLDDDDITGMEIQAENGGTFIGNKTVGSGETIGPIKIIGDLTISAGNSTPALMEGTIWVKGNIYLNGTLKLSNAYGSDSGTMIADDPDNPFSRGRIIVGNTGSLLGNSTADTYIMGLSTNTSLNEGTDPATGAAIAVSNNLVAGVVYAANGSVDVRNNADLKEVTAQKVIMQNNTSITYQSGLASVVFSAGPGASWIYQKGSYQIIDS